MGYAPELWGPSTWDTIHLLCYTAPATLTASDQLRYTAFFKALPYVLPCASCSQHLLEHYENHPIESYIHSGTALFEWSVHIHNTVNEMLGKPMVSVEDARALWKKRLGTVGDTSAAPDLRVFQSGWYKGVFIALALMSVVVAVYLVRRKKK